jgi:hypothetical protein
MVAAVGALALPEVISLRMGLGHPHQRQRIDVLEGRATACYKIHDVLDGFGDVVLMSSVALGMSF